MQIQISYIFHNCFILKIGNTAFLFDYPAGEYLNQTITNHISTLIQGTELYVFSSHVHSDHFNRDIIELGTFSDHTVYILSKEIIKKNRQFKDISSCVVAEADQSFTVQNLKFHTFKSNDQGVAFLIEFKGINIYFGGDLASWNWDGLTKAEHKLLVEYFEAVLMKLQKWTINIAFSNTDQRLPNWAGAAQFIETIKPQLFVPMHTFGETQSLAKFLAENPQLPSPVFKYQKTGDSIVLEI